MVVSDQDRKKSIIISLSYKVALLNWMKMRRMENMIYLFTYLFRKHRYIQ